MLRLLRMPRLHRLLKMTKIFKVFTSMTKFNTILFKFYEFIQINAGLMKLFQFVGTAIVCVHVASCFWFLTAKLDDFGPDTWVTRAGL